MPASRDRDLPLSFSQQRLWFLDQLAPGSVAYTLPHTVRLAGRQDVSALGAALSEIVRRHEVGLAALLGLDWTTAFLLAVTLSFSSTVFSAKTLDAKRDIGTFYGRTAIGARAVGGESLIWNFWWIIPLLWNEWFFHKWPFYTAEH